MGGSEWIDKVEERQTFAGFLVRAQPEAGRAGAVGRAQRIDARVRAAEIVAELRALVQVIARAVVTPGALRDGVAQRAGAVGRSFRVDAGVRAAVVVRQALVNICVIRLNRNPAGRRRSLCIPRQVLRSSANFHPAGQSQRADPSVLMQT